MAGPSSQGPDETMVDLLIKQVTEGLTSDEERALDAFQEASRRDFERIAAAIAVATVSPNIEAAPQALQARLEREARAFFAENKESVSNERGKSDERVATSRSRSGVLGWVAAAACLVLAAISWLRSPQPQVQSPAAEVHVKIPPPVLTPPRLPEARPTLAQERAALLAKQSTLKVNLAATKDPVAAGVTADVVWDPVTQRGFLHFAGLKPNDPTMQQYQMWIFDAERDKRYPIGAGLFNVPADTPELIVPLDAALPVNTPKAFAVTVEKPGGVVVPGLKHVVVLGAVG